MGLKNILFLAALAAPALVAGAQQTVNVVWSNGGFTTVAGTAGNENGHDSGFSILNEDGDTIWTSDAPAGYSPCFNTGAGHKFTLGGGCFFAPREFHCKSKIDGSPNECAALDDAGVEIASGKGSEDIDYIGIAVSTTGTCGVSFELQPGEECAVGQEGFTATNDGWGK